MDQDAVISRMVDVFRDVFDDDEIELTAKTSADDIEDWDSLGNVRLMIALERKFGVTLKASEAAELENVGELADVILSKLA